jgi:hypothetical protein
MSPATGPSGTGDSGAAPSGARLGQRDDPEPVARDRGAAPSSVADRTSRRVGPGPGGGQPAGSALTDAVGPARRRRSRSCARCRGARLGTLPPSGPAGCRRRSTGRPGEVRPTLRSRALVGPGAGHGAVSRRHGGRWSVRTGRTRLTAGRCRLGPRWPVADLLCAAHRCHGLLDRQQHCRLERAQCAAGTDRQGAAAMDTLSGASHSVKPSSGPNAYQDPYSCPPTDSM